MRSLAILCLSSVVGCATAGTPPYAGTGPDNGEGEAGQGDGAAGQGTLPDGGRLTDATVPTLPDGAPLPDGSVVLPDGAVILPDGAVVTDGGSPSDGSTTGPCTPGASRCGAASNSVETCNSSGTAWLFSAVCTGSCSAGACTGSCTAGDLRCNGNNVEQCQPSGASWGLKQSCSTFCQSSQCALVTLDVAANQNMDGEVVVAGTILVHSGATLNSPTGNLTLRAKSIVVENGGSISAAPTGQNPAGEGGSGGTNYIAGGGGGYGSPGVGTNALRNGGIVGFTTDAIVQAGSKGGMAGTSGGNGIPGVGGVGGGVLRLIATDSITIAGQVTAPGSPGSAGSGSYGYGGGGGSGGGILVASDSVTISGSLSAPGGSGGPPGNPSFSSAGSTGGSGRVKVLYGAQKSITGTLTGAVTQGILPPMTVTSTTHPDPSRVYNDDFPSAAISYNRAFPSLQGYYQRTSTAVSDVPTPSSGAFVATESVTIPASALPAGDNYFHISAVDATSNVSTIENTFRILVNSTPPAIASSSHPAQTTWSANANPFFQWTFPQSDQDVQGAYYVLDQYGTTVPTAAGTFIPIGQKQLLLSNLAAGIWFFHIVARDTQSYLTKSASHYQVRIGADPGNGGLLGQVTDRQTHAVSGATVTLNRGVYSLTTNTTGNFNFTTVPAGTWEVRVTAPAAGSIPMTQMATITQGNPTSLNFTLP